MQTIRTTIELDKELLIRAKQKALEEDKTLREVISEAVENNIGTGTKKNNKSMRVKKYPFRAYHLGKIKGNLSREEIYDWL